MGDRDHKKVLAVYLGSPHLTEAGPVGEGDFGRRVEGKPAERSFREVDDE